MATSKSSRFRDTNGRRIVAYTDPTKRKKVPEGCIDVWQIQSRSTVASQVFAYHGVFREFEDALTHARRLLEDPHFHKHNFSLSHKAAVLLGDRYHLVHFNSIRFKLPDEGVSSYPRSDMYDALQPPIDDEDDTSAW